MESLKPRINHAIDAADDILKEDPAPKIKIPKIKVPDEIPVLAKKALKKHFHVRILLRVALNSHMMKYPILQKKLWINILAAVPQVYKLQPVVTILVLLQRKPSAIWIMVTPLHHKYFKIAQRILMKFLLSPRRLWIIRQLKKNLRDQQVETILVPLLRKHWVLSLRNQQLTKSLKEPSKIHLESWPLINQLTKTLRKMRLPREKHRVIAKKLWVKRPKLSQRREF